jgi:hypothetical protein
MIAVGEEVPPAGGDVGEQVFEGFFLVRSDADLDDGCPFGFIQVFGAGRNDR